MTRSRIKIADWPREDRAAWDKLLAHGGLLHPGVAFAGLRPATLGIYASIAPPCPRRPA
jgi:hypothetical protein